MKIKPALLHVNSQHIFHHSTLRTENKPENVSKIKAKTK